MTEENKEQPDLSKLSEENIKNFQNKDEKFDHKKWVRFTS
jgi:hypothetical protein